MKKLVASFAAGALFTVGLVVSGMSLPSKVIGFLDLTGSWDPSLAFVMGTAIPIYAVAYRLAMRRTRPRFDNRFHLPTASAIDARLVVGAALFGVGWGLVGYCPGPALLSIATGNVGALCFVGAMVAGMALYEVVDFMRSPSGSTSIVPVDAPASSAVPGA